jgi:glutathione synthase/RimK-type ligase-like ATP-grasp enzyme
MLLIVTNKSDLASDYLILRLQERDIPFKRFNTEDYPELISIDICFRNNQYNYSIRFPDDSEITQDNLSCVYFRQPIAPAFANIENFATREFIENEFTEMLRSLWRLIPEKIWLNHPRKLWLASNKVEQLIEAITIGFSVPDTLLSYSKDSLEALLAEKNSHFVAKAVRHGFVRDYDKVLLAGTQRLPENFLLEFDYYMNVPMMYQEEVKQGCDIRSVVVGDTVFSTRIVLDRKDFVDWRLADLKGHELIHEPINLPLGVEKSCISIVQKFGLQYSSIDLMQDVHGNYYFLELNPNGQWAWIEQLAGHKIRDSIINNLIRNAQ